MKQKKMRFEYQGWAITGKLSTYHPMTADSFSYLRKKMISLNGSYIYFSFPSIKLLYVSKLINTNNIFPETRLEWRLFH